MLSQSNISYGSSHSNLLTLSRSSSSSSSSATANHYYGKFIAKLGLLFKMDNTDLDALYGKIVECVNESESFSTSDDADIAEMVQIAKNLKQSHNILKNMVEVLDHRFLRSPLESPVKAPRTQATSHQLTPIVKKQNPNNRVLEIYGEMLGATSKSNGMLHQTGIDQQYVNSSVYALTKLEFRQADSEIQTETRIQTQSNGYGGYARGQATSTYLDNNQKWRTEHSEDSQMHHNNKGSSNGEIKSKHKDRISKMMEEMSKIKKQISHLAEESEESIISHKNEDSETSLALHTLQSPFDLKGLQHQQGNPTKSKTKLSMKDLSKHSGTIQNKIQEKKQQNDIYEEMIEETARENSRSEELGAQEHEQQSRHEIVSIVEIEERRERHQHQDIAQASQATLIDSLLTNPKGSHSTLETQKHQRLSMHFQGSRMKNQRMENYMRRLEQRNCKLKDYIQKIQRSLSKSKKHTQSQKDIRYQEIPKKAVYKSASIEASQSITNSAYTKKSHPEGHAIYAMHKRTLNQDLEAETNQLQINSNWGQKTFTIEKQQIKHRNEQESHQYLMEEQYVKQENVLKVPRLEGFKQNNSEGQQQNLQNSSISDRLNQKQSVGINNKIIIPKPNTNLFFHTRDVESKVELSEERHYRQPNEEIKKIQAKVGDLFKKMKPLGDDLQETNTRTKIESAERQFRESGVGSSRIYEEDLHEEHKARISNNTGQDSKISTSVQQRQSIPPRMPLNSSAIQRYYLDSPPKQQILSFVYESPKKSVGESSVQNSQVQSPQRNSVGQNSRMFATFNPSRVIPHPQPSFNQARIMQTKRQSQSPTQPMEPRRSVSFDSRGSRSIRPAEPVNRNYTPIKGQQQIAHPRLPISYGTPSRPISYVNSPQPNIPQGPSLRKVVSNPRLIPNHRQPIQNNQNQNLPQPARKINPPSIPKTEQQKVLPPKPGINIASSVVNRVELGRAGRFRRDMQESSLSKSRSRSKRGISLCSSRKSD